MHSSLLLYNILYIFGIFYYSSSLYSTFVIFLRDMYYIYIYTTYYTSYTYVGKSSFVFCTFFTCLFIPLFFILLLFFSVYIHTRTYTRLIRTPRRKSGRVREGQFTRNYKKGTSTPVTSGDARCHAGFSSSLI